jgi:hypothetical protein
MRNSLENPRISVTEVIIFLIGLLLLMALARVVASGQTTAPGARTARAAVQVQQPLYREYRGIRLGTTATEVRAKLGQPSLKSDEQDYFVVSPNETAQFAYNTAQRVVTISTDYTDGIGAPDYRSVVGDGLLLNRPDGSVFRMVMYDSERFWVSYNKTATAPMIVTITIGAYK